MFESITRAVLAHKQIVIAAVAIAGLGIYMFPSSMFAAAQNVITRNIEIPCLPYCANLAQNPPPDQDIVIDDIVEVHIHFSLVPVGT
jgi:hypothetical protein